MLKDPEPLTFMNMWMRVETGHPVVAVQTAKTIIRLARREYLMIKLGMWSGRGQCPTNNEHKNSHHRAYQNGLQY
jgi:hypothetical protein